VVAAVLGAVLVVALLVWLVPKIGSDGEPRAKASPSTSRTTSKDSEAGGQPGAAPAAGVREAVGGSWEGSYVCAQGKTGMRLAITPTGGDRLKAVFSFFPHPDNPGTPSGSFEMQGTFAEDRLMLQGNRWIKRPTDYQLIDLDARVIEGAPKTISGSVSSGCSTFTVDRQQG
jgi:hypothetical protein